MRYVSVADAWPYPDDHFDVAVSNQVIEHVADLHFFFHELARTMKPGSISVHVFPLRRVLYEWHIKMPIVHLIEDFRFRERMIEVFSRVGIGTYPEFRTLHGIDEATYGRTSADFIQFGTFYRPWREIAKAAKHAGLRVTYRYTRDLYTQKLRSLLSRRERYRYSTSSPVLLDWISFALLPQLSTVTVVLMKPPVPDTWRQPDAEVATRSPRT